MNCQNYLSQLVNSIYYDLGKPSDYSLSRITSWFVDNSNIGKLNNLIGTNISGVAYTNNDGIITGYGFSQDLSNDQLAIYKMLFDYEYYKNQSSQIAKSASMVGNDWINLREADSSITRINKNELSKNFRTLARDAKEDLDKAVKMYLKYNAVPDQIVGDDTEGSPYYIIQEYNRVTY